MRERIVENEIFVNRRVSLQPSKMPEYEVHDKNEFYYLEKGETIYFLENKIYFLKEGCVFFVPKGCLHMTSNENSSSFERVLVQFDDSSIDPLNRSYLNILSERRIVNIQSNRHHKIKYLFQQLEHEKVRMEQGYEEMQRLYLNQLLILSVRYSDPNYKLKLDNTSFLIKQISEYIRTNYNNDINLQSLANHFSLSSSYLSRTFKQHTNIGISEYITLSKITAAKKLLLNPNATITAVATKCGFNDSNYFSAVFKKIEGITPKKYSILHRE